MLFVALLLMMPINEGSMGIQPYEPPALYITVYDWGLEGQNCFWDGEKNICTHTALMVETGDDILGWTAACPSAWLGHVTTTVVTIWGEEFWCIDAFGLPEHRRLTEVDGEMVYRIDLAFRPAIEHPWNSEIVPKDAWSREWRPMSEFYQLRVSKESD